MKKSGWILGCAIMLLAGAGVSARAQVGADTDLGRNWALRLGFFIPEREPSRQAEGDLWLTIGAERAVYQQDRWKGTFAIDYYGSNKLYNVPVTFNVRGESHKVRYGAGAGLGISHDLQEGHTGFTYNLLLGYTLQQSANGANAITADVRYHWLSTGNGMLNGWSFALGYQF